jgi:uncharacterized protein YjcR
LLAGGIDLIGYSSRMKTTSPTTPEYSQMTSRQQGRLLFAQGLSVSEIAEQFGEPRSTVESWKQRDKWKLADIYDDVTLALRGRLLLVIGKDGKSNADYKELDALFRQLERTARIERYRHGGTESDLNPKLLERNATARKKKLKNEISQDDLDKMEKAFRNKLFAYQKEWVDSVEQSRIWALLKSRQIGATNTFAEWAIIDGLKTGKNKIFMSASKAQAYQFVEYIKGFVLEHTDIELVGDPLVINGPNGQFTIYYLGTNALTAQGRHGDTLMDEFMWIRNFATFKKVASGMASQKQYRQIYLSTPSSILHESYQFWAGKDGKRKLALEIDISKAALKRPTTCADGRTRQIVTLDDAEAAGCNLFERDQLMLEYSDDEFENLFNCEFVDDSGSYFPFTILEPNMVDSWQVWRDFKPFGSRPYDGPVWVGYDPSFTGDNAALAVIAPPQLPTQPYRVLEHIHFKHLPPHVQAQHIEKVCGRYNVEYMAIDNTGNGMSVAEHVVKFYPQLVRLNYNIEIKTRMALRAKELLTRRRLQFDAGSQDVAKSFISIKKALTGSGGQMTLIASRSMETGHADKAWAIMNALERAPMTDSTNPSSNGAHRARIRVFK